MLRNTKINEVSKLSSKTTGAMIKSLEYPPSETRKAA